MKYSHLRTPRTLADCEFTCGYTQANPLSHREPTIELVAGYVLAIVIGVGLAVTLVAWWSS